MIKFAWGLPGRYRLGFLVTGSGAIVGSALDAAGLALVAPVVALIAGSSQDLADSQVVDWTRSILESVGLSFRLRSLVLLILGITAARSFTLLLMSWLTGRFVVRYEADTRSRAMHAVMRSSWPFFTHQRAGHVINTLIEEVNRTAAAYGTLNSAVGSLLNLLTYLVFAVFISWELTLATILATSVLFVIYGALSRVARLVGRLLSELGADMVSGINESISGAKILKSEGLEGQTLDHFDGIVNRRSRVQLLGMVNGGLFQSTAELGFIGLLLGGLVLGTRIFDLPSSTVLIFALIFFRIYQRLRSFQATILSASVSLPAVAVVDHFITEAEQSVEEGGSTKFQSLKSGITFDDVGFDYGNGRQILQGVTMEIPAGSTVALVGPSGIGKTTIIDLTIGLLRPTVGSVLVDGRPLDDYVVRSWRSQLAYVSQETILFHDTAFRNIAWGREGVSQEEVYDAAVNADADEFIRMLPEGYDTIIGDRGMRLSGGQRQRLALARALVRKPELLILDEATSELDGDSEARIQRAIENLHGETTVLMAAHRLSTIMTADQIVVLGDGTILEIGTSEELLTRGGAFAALYDSLASGVDKLPER